MDDLIYRQAAIDALEREKVYMSGFQSDGTIIHPFDKYNRGLEDGIEALKALPSAQPEIIRCKDCKYASPNHVYGCRLEPFDVNERSERMYSNDYCSKAILRGE